LPAGPAMQGMNLTAHKGKVYRIGGMSPRNKPGDPADNHSTADCARFDPATKKWEALPFLPEPRSSHDVVVIGDQLIVVGGWALDGSKQSWPSTIVTLDLGSAKAEWKNSPQPFKRRALMAAAHKGRMYVIGGFDDKNQIARDVSIWDPKNGQWSEGTKLPASKGLAFAPAAGEHDGKLYVSVSDGTLYRLNESTSEWDVVGRGTPRVAHRIASHKSAGVLVLGGADKGKNSDLVEAFRP
jgi:N-acetylneuraminic acid mutarotase